MKGKASEGSESWLTQQGALRSGGGDRAGDGSPHRWATVEGLESDGAKPSCVIVLLSPRSHGKVFIACKASSLSHLICE